ncbi:MAG: protease modulator HflC [Proteobacteria bacterium]|nr:protease modulator HflC [Pseudomonadota bacterium]
MNRLAIAAAALGVIVLIALGTSVYTVRQTQDALITQFGKPVRVVTVPGLHFKTPFVQSVILFDNRLQMDVFPAEETILGDQKRLIVDGFAEYRIVNPLAYYQTVGPDPDAILQRLDAVVSASMRNVLASVSMVSVLTSSRTHLLGLVLTQVRNAMKQFGVEVVDVRISRTGLPTQNTEAVLKRMRAERERVAAQLRAQGAEAALKITADADRTRTVLLANAEAEATALRGEGQAQAIGIYAKAVDQDPRFFGIWRTLQAYRQGLASGNNRLVLTPESPILRYLREAPDAGAGAGSGGATPAAASAGR